MWKGLVLAAVALVAGAVPAAAGPVDPDADGDGLSDFQEVHKYRTDPSKADSDGDGVPDGDRNERREYAYTVRSVTQVMRPVSPETLDDDGQDVRVLDETDAYVEMEVVHYPLGTAGTAIAGNPKWREDAKALAEYVAPGVTANWDEAMRTKLVAALRADGIDVDALDDKALVERVSAWLFRTTGPCEGFTTYFVHFPDGKPAPLPGLEDAVRRALPAGRTVEEQWEREVLARGMFENRTRGSCTSSAIFLSGCLRALGIPTRVILCNPVVDASDPHEMEMVRRNLTHRTVRRTVLSALGGLSGSWSAHTFNEVFVGGRWRRLNYAKLGQGILDRGNFGLMTHVLTVNDWADARAAETIGRRQASASRHDAFGHANPYSTISLSDRFGAHAKVENPAPLEHRVLTVAEARWAGDPEVPADVKIDDEPAEGRVFLRVKENVPAEGLDQYAVFWEKAPKDFVLRAEDPAYPVVTAGAARGYWANGWFYLRIRPDELAEMRPGTPYRLFAPAVAEGAHRWVVPEEVLLVREESAPSDGAAPARAGEFREMTIVELTWSDAPEAPDIVREAMRDRLALLARVEEWDGWDKMKRFTATADPRFVLEADGRPPVEVETGVGGVTTSDRRWVVFNVAPERLAKGVPYRLRPLNGKPPYRWVVRDGLVATR